jgi:hypothetical protein
VAETEAPLVELLEEVRPLAREIAVVLIREELAGLTASLNGAASETDAEMVLSRPQLPSQATNAGGRTPDTPQASTDRKTCRLCGKDLPASAFDRGRRQCKRCRRDGEKRRARERKSQPADEEPHPAPSPQRGRRSQRRLDSDRYWNERRRQLIEQARVTTEERDGREYLVRHLAPQFSAVFE